MQPLTTLEAANEELRRVRKEIGRGGDAPLRFVIAGDPTKPVFSFTLPRRVPTAIAATLAVTAMATAFGGWGGPSKALAALSAANLYAPQMETVDEARSPELPRGSRSEAAPSASAQVEAVPPTVQMYAVPEAEHFTVEVSNTGKVVQVRLTGPAGEPDEASYRALRHELRCQRSGAESPIDPRLIEMLHQIALSTGQRIQIISAFRGPGRPGDFNYHTRGMAADIRVPGVETTELRDLARSLGATGVGYYPTVQFVHVDVRPIPYFWTDVSGHGESPRYEDERTAAAEAAAPEANAAAAPFAEQLAAELLRAPSLPAAALGSPIAPLLVPSPLPAAERPTGGTGVETAGEAVAASAHIH